MYPIHVCGTRAGTLLHCPGAIFGPNEALDGGLSVRSICICICLPMNRGALGMQRWALSYSSAHGDIDKNSLQKEHIQYTCIYYILAMAILD